MVSVSYGVEFDFYEYQNLALNTYNKHADDLLFLSCLWYLISKIFHRTCET